jgi:hypothetical protein
MTPGEALRAQMDAALVAASDASGKPLEWTEVELHHLAAAARCADRLDLLQGQLDAASRAENSALVVKISAELRALDKAVGDHLGRVHVGAGRAKSEQHQRAVRARWDRRNESWANARDAGNGGA